MYIYIYKATMKSAAGELEVAGDAGEVKTHDVTNNTLQQPAQAALARACITTITVDSSRRKCWCAQT